MRISSGRYAHFIGTIYAYHPDDIQNPTVPNPFFCGSSLIGQFLFLFLLRSFFVLSDILLSAKTFALSKKMVNFEAN